jgi:hypothetical protein
MKSILDPSFRYTASFNTDLRKTFARVRREHLEDAENAMQSTADALANVSSIVRKTAMGAVKGDVCVPASGGRLLNWRKDDA